MRTLTPTSSTTDDREPVRLRGWTALVVGLGLMAVVLASTGTPLLGIAGALATMALSTIGGLEWARTAAWSPSSVRHVASGNVAPPDLPGEDGRTHGDLGDLGSLS